MPLLHVTDMSHNFGGLQAVSEYNLSLDPGQITGLIGPNGAGKTTIFNLITGIYRPSGGRVRFEGREIQGLGPQAINRRGIARTFQRSRLCLELSIFDNLMIGDHNRLNHGLVFNLLQRRRFSRELSGHVERARRLLATFSTTLADNLFADVGSFPMIDRRRIEICRALIGGPRLLLLDEPSAGMTHEETRQLMTDIIEVAHQSKDVTIIIIEHEMNVIRRITDRCVVLNFGSKIFEGVYDAMAQHPDVQEAYLGGKGEAA